MKKIDFLTMVLWVLEHNKPCCLGVAQFRLILPNKQKHIFIATAKMKKYFVYILPLFLFSCDCVQEVNGVITDYDSGVLLDDVKISMESKTSSLAYSNKYGEFTYRNISGGFRGCPDITLFFKRNGYKELHQTFPSNSPDTIEIRLKKDFDTIGIRKSIMDSVRQIEKDNFISEGMFSPGTIRPNEFDRRIWLKSEATEQEMLRLIEYPNNIVKATAFEALYRSGNPNVPEFLKKFSKSDEFVHFVSGCTGREMLLSEYCFTEVMCYQVPNGPPSPPPPNFKNKIELSDSDKALIIKEIIKNKNE